MDSKSTIRTDREVAALKPPESGHTWATVASCPGLRIKVSKTKDGTADRVFVYRAKRPDGRQESMVLGHYRQGVFGLADARERWEDMRRLRREHGSAKAVLQERKRERLAQLTAAEHTAARDSYTVSVLIDEFCDFQSKRIRSWRETERCLRIYVEPALGTRPAHAVTRADVIDIIDKLVAKGHAVQANRVGAHVRAMLNYAVERADRTHVRSNVCTGINRGRREKHADRRLDDYELRRLLRGLPDCGLTADAQDLITFILLTACRLSEATGAEFREFDLEAGLWVLPAARAKNGRQHRLPLSAQASALLKRRRRDGGRYLFPMKAKRPEEPERPMRADYIHTPLTEARESLKLDEFTPHDLRRTVATGLGNMRCPREVIAAVLNHVDATVTSIYDRRDFTAEMREWLQRWADHLDTLRTDEAVVPFRTAS